jgi:cellobiose-specific phosphotransferase system component IIA
MSRTRRWKKQKFNRAIELLERAEDYLEDTHGCESELFDEIWEFLREVKENAENTRAD